MQQMHLRHNLWFYLPQKVRLANSNLYTPKVYNNKPNGWENLGAT